jgi:hypothetical protein
MGHALAEVFPARHARRACERAASGSRPDLTVTMPAPHSSRFDALLLLTMALLCVLAWFCLHADVGMGMADEGYLWHNARLTAQGYVPVRDFRAYDPGRYYWTALWFKLTGENGLLAQRQACALFQLLGVFCALLALRRVVANRWLLLVLGLLITVAMSPRHKCFEFSLSLVAVLFAVRLIERPTWGRYMAAGVVTSLAAFFAKNWGVYILVGFLLVIALIHFTQEREARSSRRRLGWFGLGLLAGYLPEIGMLLAIPGFAHSVVDSVWRLFSPYAPVKSLPIPWPWRGSVLHAVGQLMHADTVTHSSAWNTITTPLIGFGTLLIVVLSLSYLLAFVFFLGGFAVVLDRTWKKKRPPHPLLAVTVLMGLPMLHNIAVRSDGPHLFTILPLLFIGLVALLAVLRERRQRWRIPCLVALILAALNLLAATEMVSVTKAMRLLGVNQQSIVRFQLGHDTIWLARQTMLQLQSYRQFAADNLLPGQPVLIAPYQPGLYCLLARRAPVWDAYPIHRATPAEEAAMISALQAQHVDWAIISGQAMDGVPERRFNLTHADVWAFLQREYTVVADSGLPLDQTVFHRRSPGASAGDCKVRTDSLQ